MNSRARKAPAPKHTTELADAITNVIEAYDSRFETGTGRLVGPIDTEIQALRVAAALAEPEPDPDQCAKFIELPLGTRFRYLGHEEIFVKLSNEGTGLIAEWKGVTMNFIGQGIFSFADSVNETRTCEVIIVG